jgi:shikimate 5-dehydrogenase
MLGMMNSIRKAFVTGHPIAQSRSPVIHGYWLEQYGIAGSYERIDVLPGRFDEFVTRLKTGEFVGGNVTMPHKEAAFRAADVVTELARQLEAVNTLWLEDGRLHGDNTDIIGFKDNLDQTLGTGWNQGIDTALVIGAGGAARAIIMGLLLYPGMSVTVINRTADKAQHLVAFSPERIRIARWEDMDRELAVAKLVVNTTSLGMVGYPPLHLDFSGSHPDTIVSDIVYIPLMTELLNNARKHSLRIVDGLGMLMHQAVPGFRRWFGITPEVTAQLREHVLHDIGEGG